MSNDSRDDQGSDAPTAGALHSPELTAHKREIDQTAQAIISKIGDAPLALDADQVIRIGRTRVTLDTVIATFLEGATAEEIAEDYSSLELADIYLVLGFYLRHKAIVDRYVEQRHQLGAAIEKDVRESNKNGSLREKLMDRLAIKARANG